LLTLAAHWATRPAGEPRFERATVQRLLAASEAREAAAPPAPAARTEAARAAHAQQRGSADAARTGPPPGPEAAPAAATARAAEAPAAAAAQRREPSGMIGLVGSTPADPAPPGSWSQATDGDPDRVNAMFAERIGETGGLGLGGTGLALGGKADLIPIYEIAVLARRTRERLARRAESGDEGGFTRVRDTRGTVEPYDGPPPIQPIPRPIIERIVRANGGRFRMCHALGRRRSPNVAGTVEVAFTIGAAGEVTDARDAGGELDDELVRTCVVRAFGDLSFPPPMRGVPQEAVFRVELRRDPE
jgi:hypothetical protein